ncbi:GntR family transcriptional regulator [Mycobacterium sp. NBC_00419]|uniref:GntR family transcriptional regulator n=1 Tax=Mycobacterium sp. NBC_00419 TaxID=2975989 RepID=UPI002E2179E5
MNAPTSARPANPPRPRRSQLADEVAQHLREAIMTGSLRPGTFIRLDETAAQLGVSITPVREALLTLRGEGMVRLEPRRGYVVLPLSRQDIADIYWLQATMAKELAASAVERLTDEQIDELAHANDILASAVLDGDPAAIAAAEFSFHRSFNRATGRIKLSWFLLHVARYMPPLIYVTDMAWGHAAVENHRQLIDALRRRDRETAMGLVEQEFADGAARLMEQLETSGIWR